ncbi:MAG: hypothetical protein AB7P49_11445 [Bdellovibrionales bacterium]
MGLKKIAASAIIVFCILLLVVFTLSVRVRHANSKANYISAQQAVAYCNAVDITTMPEAHRQAHYAKCAESREIAQHPPTYEEMIVYQADEYAQAVVKHVLTWKVLMTAAVAWIGIGLGWLFLWDRPRIRSRLREMEAEDDNETHARKRPTSSSPKKDIYE